ncbi:MAG: TIGR04211 family SH3 domain-containing protein [Pseudomonadota bacterium]|nr:TIGR04211 family SH3 domain-containing protein [Pseudomonadota bacterium]
MRRLRATSLAILLTLESPHLIAEEAYVIDRLLIGIHKDKDLASEIIKVLPTGTRLEVLKREAGLAQIKGPEGITGWVDAVYLMPERPARVVADALDKQNKQLEAEVKKLKERLKRLRTASAGPAAPNASRAEEPDPQASETEKLQEQNAALTRSLEEQRLRAEELRTQLAALTARSGGATPSSSANEPFIAKFKLPLIFAALALALGAGWGFYLADYLQRRRHGGFRI